MKIEYENINCPICGEGNQYEFLKARKENYTQFNGRETVWEFDNRIVICNKCGHVYLNPAPTEEILSEYYSSAMTLYDDASSFKIDNRIAILSTVWDLVHSERSFMEKHKTYCEIGSNESSEYKKVLENYFDNIISVDVNENSDADLNNVNRLNAKADVIAMYYVMEHVVDVASMLKRCYANLSDDGILVIEVPDIELYVNNPSPLELLEHVNHFSPISLMNMCGRYGYTAVYFSRSMASRDYGFVAAFMKGKMTLEDAIVLINKASMQEGWNKVEKVRPVNIQKLVENFDINDTALWCANNMCKEFLKEYECRKGIFDGLIIDEDPRKNNYFAEKRVYTSKQALEKIKECKKIIIFSATRKDVIFNRIKELTGEDVKVEYVDDWFAVHQLQ